MNLAEIDVEPTEHKTRTIIALKNIYEKRLQNINYKIQTSESIFTIIIKNNRFCKTTAFKIIKYKQFLTFRVEEN